MLDFFPGKGDFPDKKYEQEIWADITDNEIENVIPGRYKISTWGRVFDSFNGNYYPTANVKNTSYPSVHIQFIDKSYKTIKIHHIMMRRFRPLDYDPNTHTDVDHKDGTRYHNWIWNLERVTHQENIKRCVNIGLYPVGENNPHSILSDEQARSICDLIAKGYRTCDIIRILKPSIPMIDTHIINDIKGRRNYQSISKDYDFSNMSYNNLQHKKLDESVIHAICRCLEIDKSMKPKEIAERIGYDIGETYSREYGHFYHVVANLRNKTFYKDICKNYNY